MRMIKCKGWMNMTIRMLIILGVCVIVIGMPCVLFPSIIAGIILLSVFSIFGFFGFKNMAEEMGEARDHEALLALASLGNKELNIKIEQYLKTEEKKNS